MKVLEMPRPARAQLAHWLLLESGAWGLVTNCRGPGAACQSHTSAIGLLASLSAPHLCADVRSWAASGYQHLAPSTVSFDSVFMNAWVSPGDLPAALKRYETSSERSLIHNTVEGEYAIAELETREETTWWNTMDTLNLWP